MSQNKIILQAQNLSIGYKDKSLVKNINFSIYEGSLVALIGKNGVGKSTLFKSIYGEIPLLSGELLINQKNLRTYPSAEKSKLLSIVLTRRPILYGMKVLEIVKMGRHPYSGSFGALNAKDEKIVKESMRKLKIEHIQDKFLSEISDGEFQKMMLARALAQDTPLILMDEPSAFLDFPSKLELIETLANLCHEHQKTILFSTHEIPLIKDKVDVLIGITNEALKSYTVEEIHSRIWMEEILGIKEEEQIK